MRVDFNDKEMVFIDFDGIVDLPSMPINYYTLVGVLIEYGQIGRNYGQ